MKDFSIIIAHRGDPLGLWATITSCELDLKNSNYDYEYCFCINGEGDGNPKRFSVQRPLNIDTERILTSLHKDKKIGYTKVLQNSVSPPTARQFATEKAKGKYLFFFDNHCLVEQGYFKRALHDFDKYGMDMIHSTTKFFVGDITCYHYKLQLEKNFWADAATIPENECFPYKCAAGGHGGFVVTKSSWDELGGYWDGFVGYGGEEITTDLNYWLHNKTIFLDPKIVHFHWAGQRPYKRHFTDDYFKNMMMSANIIGGEPWMYKVYENFSKGTKFITDKSMYELLMEASSKSNEYATKLQKTRNMGLDELLDYFRINQIAYN